jgi:hypothetical protein
MEQQPDDAFDLEVEQGPDEFDCGGEEEGQRVVEGLTDDADGSGGGEGSALRERQCNVVWITHKMPLQRSRRASSITEIANKALHALQQLAVPGSAGGVSASMEGRGALLEPTSPAVPRVRSRVVSAARAEEDAASGAERGGESPSSRDLKAETSTAVSAGERAERTSFIYDEDTF